jgi:hypothetical protein
VEGPIRQNQSTEGNEEAFGETGSNTRHNYCLSRRPEQEATSINAARGASMTAESEGCLKSRRVENCRRKALDTGNTRERKACFVAKDQACALHQMLKYADSHTFVTDPSLKSVCAHLQRVEETPPGRAVPARLQAELGSELRRKHARAAALHVAVKQVASPGVSLTLLPDLLPQTFAIV